MWEGVGVLLGKGERGPEVGSSWGSGRASARAHWSAGTAWGALRPASCVGWLELVFKSSLEDTLTDLSEVGREERGIERNTDVRKKH